ncbi:protein of unknown function [Paraburkholderia kururiensis]
MFTARFGALRLAYGRRKVRIFGGRAMARITVRCAAVSSNANELAACLTRNSDAVLRRVAEHGPQPMPHVRCSKEP